jgi:hypothetical protein
MARARTGKGSWSSEAFVVDVVRGALERKGFKLHQRRSLHAHGVDITARHLKHQYYLFVECKGYPRKGDNEGAQRENWFVAVLGQILLRMRQKNACYVVALPDHPFYRKRIFSRGIRTAREWLGLWFFLVKRDGSVLWLGAKHKAFRAY